MTPEDERDEAVAILAGLEREAAYGRALLALSTESRLGDPDHASALLLAMEGQIAIVYQAPRARSARLACMNMVALAVHVAVAHGVRDPEMLAGLLDRAEALRLKRDAGR